jgi:hypothetical protein
VGRQAGGRQQVAGRQQTGIQRRSTAQHSMPRATDGPSSHHTASSRRQPRPPAQPSLLCPGPLCCRPTRPSHANSQQPPNNLPTTHLRLGLAAAAAGGSPRLLRRTARLLLLALSGARGGACQSSTAHIRGMHTPPAPLSGCASTSPPRHRRRPTDCKTDHHTRTRARVTHARVDRTAPSLVPAPRPLPPPCASCPACPSRQLLPWAWAQPWAPWA